MSRYQISSRFLLTDTGPLVAMVNKNSAEHQQVTAVLREMPNVPLLTTWSCLTEAMYLSHQDGGHRAQDALWGYVMDELILLHDLSFTAQHRMRELMAHYADTPMDLADASLVVTAETLGLRQVFTVTFTFIVWWMARCWKSSLEQ